MPTVLARSTRRAALAAGALVTTAAVTVATPVTTANAADNPLDPGVILSDPGLLIDLAPIVPGVIPMLVVPAVNPVIAGLVNRWHGIPVVGDILTASENASESALEGIPGDLVIPLRHGPRGWIGITNYQSVGFSGPFGVSASSTGYGTVALSRDAMADLLIALRNGTNVFDALADLEIGGVVGNTATFSGPLGGTVTTDLWLSSLRVGGATTVTPNASIGGALPFGAGNALFTVSLGAITFGDGTFLITGPSLSADFEFLGTKGDLGFTTGQVGLKDGNLVATGPTGSGGLDTPLGGRRRRLHHRLGLGRARRCRRDRSHR